MTTETKQAGRPRGRRVLGHRQLPKHQPHQESARISDSAMLEDQHRPRKIFIGGLPHTTRMQHLRDHFASFGPILDAMVLRWPDGRSRGFGYVTFATAEAAVAALQTTHHVGGKQIDTKHAVPGTHKVFVGGLPYNCTAAELREHFEAFGIVSDAVVMKDLVTNRSRGFGFVCFLPGQAGSESVAAALAEYSNHKIRRKWIEVKSAVSPHLLALDASSSTLLESQKSSATSVIEKTSLSTLLQSQQSSATSAIEPMDAPPLALLKPRTRVPLQHWKKEQMAQDLSEEDYCQPCKVPISIPTKTLSDAQPLSVHGIVRPVKDSPTAPACDLAAVPWRGSVLRDDADGVATCYSEPALLPTLGGLSDTWKVDGNTGLFAIREALQQSLAELLKQESFRNPSV